jgi:cyanophycinase-like exopeptidase
MGRFLALMGSGENSPIMVTPHQKIIKATGKDLNPLNLSTPYGFQENKDELSAKIEKYFEVNVGTKVTTSDNLLSDIENSSWAFAGPGSPTYNLKQWKSSGADKALSNLLGRGSLVLASAAAMSIGNKVMPVYEMYKVGDDPYWLDGLNILEAATGIKAAVIAHYNNAQGGTHDTRYCFAGQKRMTVLETQLDNEVAILGIDEHTGIAFDLESKSAEVFGKGVITFKRGDSVKTYENKAIVPLSEFIN